MLARPPSPGDPLAAAAPAALHPSLPSAAAPEEVAAVAGEARASGWPGERLRGLAGPADRCPSEGMDAVRSLAGGAAAPYPNPAAATASRVAGSSPRGRLAAGTLSPPPPPPHSRLVASRGTPVGKEATHQVVSGRSVQPQHYQYAGQQNTSGARAPLLVGCASEDMQGCC